MKSENELVHSFLLMGSQMFETRPAAMRTPPAAKSQAVRSLSVERIQLEVGDADADADGQREVAAFRSWRPATATAPTAATTPATLLALRSVASVLIEVWSVVRTDFKLPICWLHRLPAALPRLDRFD